MEHRGPTRRRPAAGTVADARSQHRVVPGRPGRLIAAESASRIVGGVPRRSRPDSDSGRPQARDHHRERAGEIHRAAELPAEPTGRLAPASILDNLATAIAVVDASARITALNPAAESFFGVSERTALGRGINDLGPGLQALDELIQRAIANGQAYGQNLELHLPHLDNQLPLMACRVSALQGVSPAAFVIELLDASQWRQLDREKALISQHGASRKMISQLAHEVRNPLGGLRGAAQLLDRELDDPDLKEYTQVIIREADRLAALTDDLLGPIRQACSERLNVHELLERVILLLENSAPREIAIFRDYDPSLPALTGDADQLIQAALNLGRNAIQALGESGQLIFRTRALIGYVIGDVRHRLVLSIEIEDDGPGVPDEIRDSLFYPLVTGRDDGTGLGLPLAQDLASRHGGLVEFESAPGRTVFMLRLPVEPGHE